LENPFFSVPCCHDRVFSRVASEMVTPAARGLLFAFKPNAFSQNPNM
jgi:hypothetical protein